MTHKVIIKPWTPDYLNYSFAPSPRALLNTTVNSQELISRSARLAYPVRDGIPVLLENEARTLTDAELGL
jgi:uncharacterized protein YbaR (Trm112 family)